MELSYRPLCLSVGTGLLLCACLHSNCFIACAQDATATRSATEIHIGVIERSESVRLSVRNVSASIAGKNYAVAITPGVAQFPTHLLVVLESGPKNSPPYRDAMETIRPALDRGWLVSIVRPDGHETPYASSEAALAAALQSTASPGFDYGAAFNELAGFTGRRVLIIEQSLKTTDPPMLAMARSLIPEIYRVDGGMIAKAEPSSVGSFSLAGSPSNPDDPGVDFSHPPTPAASVQPPPTPPRQKARSANGVMHEVKFGSAVKDALADAQHYYDLDLKVPASGLGGRLLLTYHHLHRNTIVFSELQYVTASIPNDGAAREPLNEPLSVKRQ